MPPGIALLTVLAAAPARFETPGLALAAEAGRFAGGAGLDAVYYHPLPLAPRGWPLTLSAQLGAGISGERPRSLAVGGSLGASLGGRNRALLTLGWGAIGRSTLSLHGTVVAERSLYGPDAAFGYELVTARGLLFRALAGVAHLPRSWQETSARFRPTFTVAFGWKLW